MDRVRLDHLLLMARTFQKVQAGRDLLRQMKAAEPRGEMADRWQWSIHRTLTERVYRMIINARTRQKAPGQEAFDAAMLWFAAVWPVAVDWAFPRAAEVVSGWPALAPHPFVAANAGQAWPRPSRLKEAA